MRFVFGPGWEPPFCCQSFFLDTKKITCLSGVARHPNDAHFGSLYGAEKSVKTNPGKRLVRVLWSRRRLGFVPCVGWIFCLKQGWSRGSKGQGSNPQNRFNEFLIPFDLVGLGVMFGEDIQGLSWWYFWSLRIPPLKSNGRFSYCDGKIYIYIYENIHLEVFVRACDMMYRWYSFGPRAILYVLFLDIHMQ